MVRDHGLVCTMGSGGGGTIAEGLNDPANHDGIVAGLSGMIPRAAKAGVPNVITMVGNRKPGLDDATATTPPADHTICRQSRPWLNPISHV